MTLLARHAAADPLLVGFVRLAIAAPFLLGAALVSTRNWRLTTGRDAPALLVIGPRGLGEISSDFALGAVLALGAGLSYAMYTVIGKGTLARVSPLPLAGITFTVAALTLSPVLLSEHAVAEPLAKGWPLFLYLGLIPTALAYGLFTVGLRRIPATVAGITTLLEPLTAATLGVLLFGERLGVAGTIGAALLLAAIALLVVRR